MWLSLCLAVPTQSAHGSALIRKNWISYKLILTRGSNFQNTVTQILYPNLLLRAQRHYQNLTSFFIEFVLQCYRFCLFLHSGLSNITLLCLSCLPLISLIFVNRYLDQTFLLNSILCIYYSRFNSFILTDRVV